NPKRRRVSSNPFSPPCPYYTKNSVSAIGPRTAVGPEPTPTADQAIHTQRNGEAGHYSGEAESLPLPDFATLNIKKGVFAQ
ncbi:MAG: hypothetical protein MJ249_15815, partial [Kiritimatiellae bacterium]|nr:hypothetical protein [Kiritimatiellia bacterium]